MAKSTSHNRVVIVCGALPPQYAPTHRNNPSTPARQWFFMFRRVFK
jgi:hypothetical protein